MKKIYILVGHPDNESTDYSFIQSYKKGAEEAGYEVRLTQLADLKFDPILHKGYKVIQELEPDLKKVQEDISWCDHFVIIYPIWWAGMPALLKGMFERIWMPGFAFRFKKEGLFKGLLWDKYMKAKTARVFVTMDNVPIVARILFGDITNEMHFGILGFAGFKVKVKKIGRMKFLSDVAKNALRNKFVSWGREMK